MKSAKHLIESVTDEGSFVTHATQPRFVWGVAKFRSTHVIIACNEMDEALGAMGYQELSEFAKAFSLAASDETPLIWLARGSGFDVTERVSAAFESGHAGEIGRLVGRDGATDAQHDAPPCQWTHHSASARFNS